MNLPEWFTKAHADYIDYMMYSPLPFSAKGIDSQRMLLIYMLVGSAKVIGHNINHEAIAAYIMATAVKDTEGRSYGFSHSSPWQEAHVVHTYCAIASLAMMEQHSQLQVLKSNANNILAWVHTLVNADGSIRGSATSLESDLRMIFSACALLDILGIDKGGLKNGVPKYILSCQNVDGGFGLQPDYESHGGATYCAIATLTMLGQHIPARTQLIKWLVDRQVDLGIDDLKRRVTGFQGRVGKVPDSCYSFWCGWSLALLGLDHLIEDEPLSNFLASCQCKQGGFSRLPFSRPDPIHTFHSICGLILHNKEQIVLSSALIKSFR